VGAIVQKWRRNVQDYGLGTAASKALAFLARPVYEHRTYRIYRINTRHPVPETAPTGSRFRFVRVSEEDGAIIEQVEAQAEWLRDQIGDRLTSGDICIAALDGDRVAGFNLIAFGDAEIPLLRTRHVFRPGTAWSDHIAVGRDYRRQGLGVELRRRILDTLQAEGVRVLYGGTLSSNVASLQLAKRVGFKELVDVEFTRVLAGKRWRLHRLPRTDPALSARPESTSVNEAGPRADEETTRQGP
jgi:RimJ/RimL family protein N-acetyltransferase